MTGAATLCALGAMRAGASMVRIGAPGVAAGDYGPIEAVAHALPTQGLYRAIEDELHRCSALIVGPGLGRSPHLLADVRELLLKTTLPVVIDADALYALDGNTVPFAGDREVVMTPHEGELAHLLGHSVGADPLGEAAELARRSGATVLRKGPVTVIARSGITPLLITSGTSALATAGTGDVLSGVVGALMARGLDSVTASALGAYVHGLAGANAPMEGLIASDLPPLIANELAEHSRHQIRDR
jgi:NAD(P)H-hydrate epimerase